MAFLHKMLSWANRYTATVSARYTKSFCKNYRFRGLSIIYFTSYIIGSRSATVLNFLLEVVLELTGDWYDYCHFQLNRFHFSTRRHIANVQFREKLNNSHVQFHFSAWSWCPGCGEMVSVLVYLDIGIFLHFVLSQVSISMIGFMCQNHNCVSWVWSDPSQNIRRGVFYIQL